MQYMMISSTLPKQRIHIQRILYQLSKYFSMTILQLGCKSSKNLVVAKLRWQIGYKSVFGLG